MVSEEFLENLPDGEPTDEELIALGKYDEMLSPLTEDEIDEYLASAKEANLQTHLSLMKMGWLLMSSQTQMVVLLSTSQERWNLVEMR